MSSRFQASALATEVQIPTELTSVPATSPSASERRKAWVDPAALPDYGDTSDIGGNAPNYVKQLNNNTYMAYGVGSDECFGHRVGKTVKFVKVNIERNDKRQGRLSATTVAEVQVSKCEWNFVSSRIWTCAKQGTY
jgi:acyl-coenzyme A thioesterase 13